MRPELTGQYKRGSSSVHGKVKVQPAEGGAGASDLTSQGGVQVTRVGKVRHAVSNAAQLVLRLCRVAEVTTNYQTTFKTTVPALHLTDIPVRFPRQVLQPAYEKKTDVSVSSRLQTSLIGSQSKLTSSRH